jgi:DNA repair ATPase RecN
VPPVNAATALVDAAAAAASRKALLGDAERRVEQLEEEFDVQGRNMARLATELTQRRAAAVAAMEAAAHAALAQLGMGKSRFAVKLARTRPVRGR